MVQDQDCRPLFLVTSGSDTHWVPVTQAFFWRHGLSYHLLPCAQAAAWSLHPYVLLIIKYQTPPPVPTRLSAQLPPFHRARTLHFIAYLHVLKLCFNKNAPYCILQKNSNSLSLFSWVLFFKFYFNRCPLAWLVILPTLQVGPSALDSLFARDSST